MKKLLTISVITITLVILLTGTTVASVAGNAQTVDVQVVDEEVKGMVKFGAGGVGSSLSGFPNEEIIALYLYPISIDSVKESQTQALDAGPSLPDFTKEELEAMYPGYLEWFTASQAQK